MRVWLINVLLLLLSVTVVGNGISCLFDTSIMDASKPFVDLQDPRIGHLSPSVQSTIRQVQEYSDRMLVEREALLKSKDEQEREIQTLTRRLALANARQHRPVPDHVDFDDDLEEETYLKRDQRRPVSSTPHVGLQHASDFLASHSPSDKVWKAPAVDDNGVRKAGKPRKFPVLSYDTKHPLEWVEEVESYVMTHFEDQLSALTFIDTYLGRDVKNEIKLKHDFYSMPPERVFTFLRDLFKKTKSAAVLQIEFDNIVQKKETVRQFAQRLIDQMMDLRRRTSKTTAEVDLLLRDKFIHGLSSSQLKRRLLDMTMIRPAYTFDDVRKVAENDDEANVVTQTHELSAQVDGDEEVLLQQSAQYAFKSRVDNLEVQLADQSKLLTEMLGLVKEKKDKPSGAQSASDSNVWRKKKNSRLSKKKPDDGKKKQRVVCTFCNKTGHEIDSCFQKQIKDGIEAQRVAPPSASSQAATLNQYSQH